MPNEDEIDVLINLSKVIKGLHKILTREKPGGLPVVIREGSKGVWVAYAKRLLDVDSYFDSDLTVAVKEFQKDNNLKVDGIIGQKETWPALLKDDE